MKKKVITKSPEESIKLGVFLGEKLSNGCVITLDGDLGAGKTTFTKGIARGLGIIDPINSPTFTLMKNYEGNISLNHIDAYRLEGIGFDYDLEEYIYSNDISVIEWPTHIQQSIPSDALNVTIKRLGDKTREFVFSSDSAKYETFFKEVL